MKKISAFFKKETVLSIAWILAIISMFLVKPSLNYISYIDFKSLGILWSLMIIVALLNETGLFDTLGKKLLKRTKYVYQLSLALVLMPFFLSMFITNDVALLTFVPFAIYILDKCGRKELLIPVIALQTIGANLGSMLTPIGNPQNLYLYGLSGTSLWGFVKILLPYSLVSAFLIVVCIFLIPNQKEEVTASFDGKSYHLRKNKKLYVYMLLFVLAVLSVAFPKIIPFYVVVVVVLIVCLLLDRKILGSIDYALLFTFIGFFILTGNLGKIEVMQRMMERLVAGRETYAGIIFSQFISNVPAALLLSGFTNNIKDLIVGVNLGGLGTLIASMASLISFKLLAHKYNDLKGRYFTHFTVMNIAFLAILIAEYLIIG